MITYEDIIAAQTQLVEAWGEDGKRVIEACLMARPFGGTYDQFLSLCTACGGNWGAMLLTGIKGLFPQVYKEIPQKMGEDGMTAFLCLCNVLILCGVIPIE